MHVLDIGENSTKANGVNINMFLWENIAENKLFFSIEDDGDGMDKETLEKAITPFGTSRTERKVGLGIPMLKQTCEQCGGYLEIESEVGKGTKLTAVMDYDSIDRPPLGNIGDSIFIYIFSHRDLNIVYTHKYNEKEFVFDLEEIRGILDGVSFDTPEIYTWLQNYIKEGIEETRK